jgi:ankyrin repeat protein
MRYFSCAILIGGPLLMTVVVGPQAAQENKKAPADEVTALIDQFTRLDRQDTGYSGSVSGSSFLPLGESSAGTMLLFQAPGEPSDALRSLVKLGVKALPTLLDHLKDDRPTKIVLKHRGGFGGMFISRDKAAKKGKKDDDDVFGFGDVSTEYTVMVGDLCYVAVGQIVNRNYWAVRYQPTAIIMVTSVPNYKELRDKLIKEWGNLTPEKHRDSLVRDLLDSDNEYARNGASIRLAYYYPEALEAAALKQLARPSYDGMKVQDLVRGLLYKATTAKERKALVDAFAAKHGEIGRDGIRWYLFDDLGSVEADEEGRLHPKMEKRYPARECLVDAFGLPAGVKSKDRPAVEPLHDASQARFVQTLHYDRSEKLDQALRDLLAKTDDDYLAKGCLDRLVGRGYDIEIEAYLKRRLPVLKEADRGDLRAYEPKLGWTRLHAAVDLGVPEWIDQAIRDKTPVNARAKDGRTALHVAALLGKVGAARMLLEAKADPNIQDGKGALAVQLAADADHAEIVRLLAAKKSEVPDVMVAAVAGDSARLTELLKQNADAVKQRNQEGMTPLHVAAREGHLDAVKVLLATGADMKAVDDPKGKYRYPNGWTPLHYAVLSGNTAIAKLLIDKGADVNAVDQRGKHTPLHFAAFAGNVELVTLLLDRRADRTLRDSEKRTPLDLAKERKKSAVVTLLEK